MTLNFGGSDTLAAAITGGAPVDVFAAASTKTMTTVTAADDGAGTPVTFAKNELEIAVPPSNPAKIASLADTVKTGVKLVTCAATVPCGAAATKAYAAAKLTPKPVSLEPDVKSVLTKVELNEADAGIVYQTDVLAAGAKVTGINFPEAAQAIATYPIVRSRTASTPRRPRRSSPTSSGRPARPCSRRPGSRNHDVQARQASVRPARAGGRWGRVPRTPLGGAADPHPVEPPRHAAGG